MKSEQKKKKKTKTPHFVGLPCEFISRAKQQDLARIGRKRQRKEECGVLNIGH